MKAGGGGRKGAQFERAICKRLSVWWSQDEGRDDIFWRSSQSGGRATERAKKGKRTFGSYGDIAAVDPIGQPLLKFFTIELKRGRSHGSLGDLMDLPKDCAEQAFERCMSQAQRSAEHAGSRTWMLVLQRDRRVCMAYMPTIVFRELDLKPFHIVKTRSAWRVGAIPFDLLLDKLDPQTIKAQI